MESKATASIHAGGFPQPVQQMELCSHSKSNHSVFLRHSCKRKLMLTRAASPYAQAGACNVPTRPCSCSSSSLLLPQAAESDCLDARLGLCLDGRLHACWRVSTRSSTGVHPIEGKADARSFVQASQVHERPWMRGQERGGTRVALCRCGQAMRRVRTEGPRTARRKMRSPTRCVKVKWDHLRRKRCDSRRAPGMWSIRPGG
jgi:hypothetical protein